MIMLLQIILHAFFCIFSKKTNFYLEKNVRQKLTWKQCVQRSEVTPNVGLIRVLINCISTYDQTNSICQTLK